MLGQDTNISIIQYFKTGETSIENEISNIQAEKDIDIKVRQYFINSPDYQQLQKILKIKEQQLLNLKELSKRKFLIKELENLRILEKEFKLDTLRLIHFFTRIKIKTKRLEQVKKLINEGKLKEADSILIESDLSNDQFNLLLQADYLENRKAALSIF